MRFGPSLIALLLVPLALPASVDAGAGIAVESFFANPEDGDATYRITGSPVLVIGVRDANGAFIEAHIRLFVEADEFNNAQLGNAIDVHADDGVAVVAVPRDINIVGFLPGAHTVWLLAETAAGDGIGTATFDVTVP